MIRRIRTNILGISSRHLNQLDDNHCFVKVPYIVREPIYVLVWRKVRESNSYSHLWPSSFSRAISTPHATFREMETHFAWDASRIRL